MAIQKRKPKSAEENDDTLIQQGKNIEAARTCSPVKGINADFGKSISLQSQVIPVDRTINRS